MRSGRYSPINSPTRGRMGREEDSDVTSDIDPPSYHSTKSVSSKSQKIYSNLMSYLESVDSNNDINMKDDDMSSVSHSMIHSPQKSTYSNTSRTSKYVWDNIDNHNSHNIPLPNSSNSLVNAKDYDDTTYFRPPSYISDQSSVTTTTSSIQHAVDEIKDKVTNMKNELSRKNIHIKQLQGELTRLITAKNRKYEKFESNWNKKLNELHEENTISINKQQELINKIENDILQLTEKCNILSDKLNKMNQIKDDKILHAVNDIKNKRLYQMKQNETDEKVQFEKILTNKSNQLKKQAADNISPQLDLLINENRVKIIQKTELLDIKLLKNIQSYRDNLQQEHENSINILIEKLEIENENSIHLRQNHLKEIENNYKLECDKIQSKYYNDKKLLDEVHNKKKHLNEERWMNSIQLVKEEEHKKVF
jgi:hypothetical protein